MRTLIVLLSLFLVACSSALPSVKTYKLDIQQGNVITPRMMLQLKPGMSKSQVRFVLGTPLLTDSFHRNRWDYFYEMNRGGTVIERRRLILEFENENLKTVRGDITPAGQPGAEGAPIASVKEIRSATSSKDLLEEEAGKPWWERFKFWADDDAVVQQKEQSVDARKPVVVAVPEVAEKNTKPATPAANPQTEKQAQTKPTEPVASANAKTGASEQDNSEQQSSRPIPLKSAAEQADLPPIEGKPIGEQAPPGRFNSKATNAKPVTSKASQEKANKLKPELAKPESVKSESAKPEPVQADSARARLAEPVAETAKAVAAAPVNRPTASTATKQADLVPPPVTEAGRVSAQVQRWNQAWQSRRLNDYLNLYSANFVPQENSRRAWLEQQQQKFGSAEYVEDIQIENIQVEVHGSIAIAYFDQISTTAAGSKKVSKEMNFENEGGLWRIVRESVKTDFAPSAKDVPPSEPNAQGVILHERSEAPPEYPAQPAANKSGDGAAPQANTKANKNKNAAPSKKANKDAPLPAEDEPGYFEKLLEKIGF